MKQKNAPNLGKEVYKQLRAETWEVLWTREVPLFDAGSVEDRAARVGLVRAIGVVSAEQGTLEQKQQTREWLTRLLQDPNEKIRRYAMNALPKLGGTVDSEAALLSLLDAPKGSREVKNLSRTLDKIGGEATLEKLEHLDGASAVLRQTEQKIKAQIARKEAPATIRMDVKIREIGGLRIHLRTRRGMETLLRQELDAHPTLSKRFKLLRASPGCVALAAKAPFTLAELYELRTFGSVGFVLGVVPTGASKYVSAVAELIASKQSQRLCSKLTEGHPRYRLEVMRKKLSSSKTQAIVNAAFALCPEILNDARKSPWAVEVFPEKVGDSVELRPRILPDPRFIYRADDVPASTHPPLAAAMARMGTVKTGDIVWDPFCGSGLELIECARLGEVGALIASDIDAKAIKVAGLNFEAAGLASSLVEVHRSDFREHASIGQIEPSSVDLLITNPPLGRRVRIHDLKGFITDLYGVAAKVLKPGGRLVFINPLKLESTASSLRLSERHLVDIGGFDCRVETWVRK